MEKEDIFIVGYGGWVNLWRNDDEVYNYQNEDEPYTGGIVESAKKGTMLQVTQASVSRQVNVPTLSSYYLPFNDPDGTARSQIRCGEGTYAFSGELSFEMTQGVLEEIFDEDFFERESLFSVMFYDGNEACRVTNCVWSNIGIQCSPGNHVNMSISYQSNNGYEDDLDVNEFSSDDIELEYDENDLLIPYWTCGQEDFKEFDINFERSVTPVFLNGDCNTAAYLRPGLVTVSLNATCLDYIDDWEDELEILLGAGTDAERSLIIKKAVLMSSQYNMSSMSDIGVKTYSWNSISTKAFDKVFSIEGLDDEGNK